MGQTKGSPLPQVSWFLNGRPLSEKNGKIKIEDLGNGKHQITIMNVAQEDLGLITCVAKNGAGEAKCEAKLSQEGADAGKMDGDVILPETATQQQSKRKKQLVNS